MSQTPNPYAQFGQPPYGPGYGGDFIDPSPRRTSIMAIIALVVSIVGCIACIIPGPGAIATIIGGLAVFFIARSAGRLSGMGLAVTAVVLGLLQSILWIFVVFTMFLPAMSFLDQKYIGPMDAVITGIDQGDMKAARGMFTPAANAAITDEMLADFAQRYQAEVGAYQAPPKGTVDMFFKFINVGQAMQGVQQAQNRRPGQPQNLLPMPATFSKADAIVVVHADMTALEQNAPNQKGDFKFPIVNIGVLTTGGKQIWLMDEKKAIDLMGTLPDSPGTSDAPSKPSSPDATPSDKPNLP